MKRIITIFMAMLMIFAMTGTAMAEDTAQEVQAENEQTPDSEDVVWDIKYAGLKFHVPKEYVETKGVFAVSVGREIFQGEGVYLTEFDYLSMTREEYEAMMSNPDPSQEEIDEFYKNLHLIAEVLSIDKGRGKEDFARYFTDFDEGIESMYEIGSVEDHTFYFHQELFDETADLGEYGEEFRYLSEHPELITDNLEFSIPKDANAFSDLQGLSFETTDLDGNPVTSQELFAENKVTMVNIWTSWCHYCIEEMPELEKLSNAFKEQGGAVIGLLYDAGQPGAIDKARDIIKDAGVTYPVIVPWEGIENDFSIQGYPTTVFVDSEGNFIGEPVIGARLEAYKTGMQQALAEN